MRKNFPRWVCHEVSWPRLVKSAQLTVVHESAIKKQNLTPKTYQPPRIYTFADDTHLDSGIRALAHVSSAFW